MGLLAIFLPCFSGGMENTYRQREIWQQNQDKQYLKEREERELQQKRKELEETLLPTTPKNEQEIN
jgi:hypothetical protein